ncbi:MAG TPA: hypothetical protein VNC50_03475 [Planctomycetia bacterium]|nr:hypothetical protein [Planctomycetia bacterium]
MFLPLSSALLVLLCCGDPPRGDSSPSDGSATTAAGSKIKGDEFHDLRGTKTNCPIHGDKLIEETQYARVGHILYSNAYYEDRERLFPDSNQMHFVFGPPNKVKVRYCPNCRRIEDEWQKSPRWDIPDPVPETTIAPSPDRPIIELILVLSGFLIVLFSIIHLASRRPGPLRSSL